MTRRRLGGAWASLYYDTLRRNLGPFDSHPSGSQNAAELRDRTAPQYDDGGWLFDVGRGQSPRFIQDKLNAYLDEEVRFDIGSQLR